MITRRKTYIEVEWHFSLLHTPLPTPQKVLSSDDKKAWKARSIAWNLISKIKETATSQHISARLNSASKRKRQQWLREKAAEARGVLQQFMAEKDERLEKIQRYEKALNCILRYIRKKNSEYLKACREAKKREREEARKAFNRGEFWRADEDYLKKFFNPPFSKSKLTDVSEKWRACVFVELEYWQGEGLRPTTRAYLCGIDDNGQKWGQIVQKQYDSWDYQGWSYSTSVEEVMSEVFGCIVDKDCIRQGDVLIRPVDWNTAPDLEWEKKDELRINGSHILFSPDMKAAYIRGVGEIYYVEIVIGRLEHRGGHQPITLQPGRYIIHLPIGYAD